MEASLGVTVDKLDKATSERLQQLQSIVDDFQRDAAATAKDVQGRAQTMVNTLPLANGQPQVASWSSAFRDSKDPLVTITMTGNFTQAQQKGMSPKLELGGRTFAPETTGGANTTQQLSFVIPGPSFGSPVAGAVNPVTATLTVPYHSAIFKIDKTARFSLLFGILPDSPGTLSLRHVVHHRTLRRSTCAVRAGTSRVWTSTTVEM